MWVDKLEKSDVQVQLGKIIRNGSLHPVHASACAVAAAVMTGNGALVSIIFSGLSSITKIDGLVPHNERESAIKAANNMAFYGVLANLFNDSDLIPSDPSVRYSAYCLAALAVQCNSSTTKLVDRLKANGYTDEQINDITNIAASINYVAKSMIS